MTISRILLVSLTVFTAAVSHAGLAYAVSFDFDNSSLYVADTSTGTATLVGATGVARLNSLTYANRQLVTAQDGSGSLYTINTSTGAATLLTTVTGTDFDGAVRALAHRDGTFYAIQSPLSVSQPDSLFAIVGGTATRVAVLSRNALQGMTFSDTGTLFAWDLDSGLVTIDPLTGALADVNPAIGSSSPIQTLYFAGNQLYGLNSQGSFLIDTTTGQLTSLAPAATGWTDFRGAEAVPEPATLAALAALALLATKKQKTTP